MDSHECPEYRAGRYCARIAQVFSKKKTKYCDLRLVGQVLSPNGEDLKARNMSRDLKKYLLHSQQGLKTRNLRSLPWSRSHQMGMPLCMDNIKMLCWDHICRGGEKGFEQGCGAEEPTHFGRSRSRSRRNSLLGAGAGAGAVKNGAAPAPKRDIIGENNWI